MTEEQSLVLSRWRHRNSSACSVVFENEDISNVLTIAYVQDNGIREIEVSITGKIKETIFRKCVSMESAQLMFNTLYESWLGD